MKLSVAALAGVAAIASAQGLGDIPKCAQGCATSAIPEKCGADIKCICSDSAFIESITCCIADSCSAAEQKDVISFANKICGVAGITDLPESVACSTGSQTATQTASESGTTSGTASETTSGSSSGTATNEATTSGTHTGSHTGTSTGSTTNGGASPSPTESDDGDNDDDDTSPTETGAGAGATESGNAAVGLTTNGGLLAAVAAFVMAVA